jgi:hypothetical protein
MDCFIVFCIFIHSDLFYSRSWRCSKSRERYLSDGAALRPEVRAEVIRVDRG